MNCSRYERAINECIYREYECRIWIAFHCRDEVRYNHRHDPVTGRFISGDSLTNGGGSGKMNDSGYEFYPVSPDAYDKIENLGVFGDERDKKIQDAMKHVLDNVIDKEPGTESIALYSLENISYLNEDISEAADGSVKSLDADVPYISIHNHASGKTFSLGDLVELHQYDNCKAIFVVGNNGSTYALVKQANYDCFGFNGAIFGQLYRVTSYTEEQFLKECEKNGLKYYKGTN